MLVTSMVRVNAYQTPKDVTSVSDVLNLLADDGYHHSFREKNGVWHCLGNALQGVRKSLFHIHQDEHSDRSTYVHAIESECGLFKGYYLHEY